MQADDWWTQHRGETSAQIIRDDTADDEQSSGDGGPRRGRHGRWRLPIDDDYYYYYYTKLYDVYDYDASGSGGGDVGLLLDLLPVFSVRITWKPEYAGPPHLLRRPPHYAENPGYRGGRLTFAQHPQSIRGLITKKILRLSYDVIITYDNRKSNLR